MKMPRALITTPLLAALHALLPLPQPAFSATEYEDAIPLDVAIILLDYSNSGQLAVYSDILDDFPDFQLPPGFTVFGSSLVNNTQRVALRTTLARDEAIQAIEEVFIGQGWQLLPLMPMPQRDTGFISSAPASPRYSNLCHDREGQLYLSNVTQDNSSYVVVNRYIGNGIGFSRNSCEQQGLQITQSISSQVMGRGLGEYFPRMELPSTRQNQPQAFMLAGFSSSNQDAETEAAIEIDWTIDELFRHFADQISAQDWAVDSESVGSVSATGTWTKDLATNDKLIGTLSVTSLGEDRYQMKFRLVTSGVGGGGASGLRIIRGN